MLTENVPDAAGLRDIPDTSNLDNCGAFISTETNSITKQNKNNW